MVEKIGRGQVFTFLFQSKFSFHNFSMSNKCLRYVINRLIVLNPFERFSKFHKLFQDPKLKCYIEAIAGRINREMRLCLRRIRYIPSHNVPDDK